MATKQFDFKEFAKNWTAPIVARSQVKEFSGGLLHPRTMANIDCEGAYRGIWYDVECLYYLIGKHLIEEPTELSLELPCSNCIQSDSVSVCLCSIRKEIYRKYDM